MEVLFNGGSRSVVAADGRDASLHGHRGASLEFPNTLRDVPPSFASLRMTAKLIFPMGSEPGTDPSPGLCLA
jgi:hypothetical protein